MGEMYIHVERLIVDCSRAIFENGWMHPKTPPHQGMYIRLTGFNEPRLVLYLTDVLLYILGYAYRHPATHKGCLVLDVASQENTDAPDLPTIKFKLRNFRTKANLESIVILWNDTPWMITSTFNGDESLVMGYLQFAMYSKYKSNLHYLDCCFSAKPLVKFLSPLLGQGFTWLYE